MSELDAEWIVIGAGAAGSATTLALARAGVRVVCLEQFEPNHTRGSSHGRTRILRTAYSEGGLYVPMVRRARREWRALGRRAGVELFRPTGALILGRREVPLVRDALVSAQTHRVRHELLDGADVAERFPAFAPSSEEVGVWDPAGGVLFPEVCLRVESEEAEKRGARFFFREPVRRWEAGAGGVRVRTVRREWRTRGLVLAAGAWTSGLVAELDLPLEIERQSVFWLPSAPRGRTGPDAMPAFVWQKDRAGYYYGVPDFGDGVKLASDRGVRLRRPSSRPPRASARERSSVLALAQESFRGVRPRVRSSVSCLYTNSPGKRFLIDRHPGHPEVVVVSACSGHGFKFSIVVGEAAAALALGRTPPFPLDPFRLPTTRKRRHSPGG